MAACIRYADNHSSIQTDYNSFVGPTSYVNGTASDNMWLDRAVVIHGYG